jgi:hypothetical protein
MSIYVTMSSDRALHYFPQNKSYNFKTHLNASHLLGGVWKVALVDVDIVSSTSKTEAIYLYSSICGEYIVEGEKKPLLRRLPATIRGNWSTNIEAPLYVPVTNNNIYAIGINITTNQDDLASFIDQPSTVTLHFKSFPFF